MFPVINPVSDEPQPVASGPGSGYLIKCSSAHRSQPHSTQHTTHMCTVQCCYLLCGLWFITARGNDSTGAFHYETNVWSVLGGEGSFMFISVLLMFDLRTLSWTMPPYIIVLPWRSLNTCLNILYSHPHLYRYRVLRYIIWSKFSSNHGIRFSDIQIFFSSLQEFIILWILDPGLLGSQETYDFHSVWTCCAAIGKWTNPPPPTPSCSSWTKYIVIYGVL